MTVADFSIAFERGDITINREYQRSDKVWPDAAKSFLIETLVLGYPLPKLAMYQITDLRSRRTIKEIVDGQQRSVTINDFYNNRLRLSSKLQTERLRGRRYDTLDEVDKESFLTYSLPVDLFVAATAFDIRETFRRMNSYTVPLNAEEQRHAKYQGPFKWFIYNIAQDYEETFLELHTFNAKKLVRMQDTKLISEVVHALESGIQTTSKLTLDRLYEKHDQEYANEDSTAARFTRALELLNTLAIEINNTPNISKPHMIYSLILALTHARRAVPALNSAYTFDEQVRAIPDSFITSLEWLNNLIEADAIPRKHQALYNACTVKTNVRSERIVRFVAFCRALANQQMA